MDRLSRVDVFLEVVRHESFSAAARQLGVQGPALSKQVRALEEDLGVRLLNRTTRQVSLTEEGAIYAERARLALGDLKEAEQQIRDLRDHPSGTLRVSAPMTFGARYGAGLIADFAARYPDVRMEVDFEDRPVDPVGEGYDVVIRIGALADSTLIARKIADCPIFQVASAEFVARHGTPETPDKLPDFPAIVFTQHQANSEWQYRHRSGETGRIRYEKGFGANNADMMIEACRRGLGIAELPIFAVAEALERGELVRVLPDYETDPLRGIYAVYPPNRYVSARVRLFVEALVEFGRGLPW